MTNSKNFTPYFLRRRKNASFIPIEVLKAVAIIGLLATIIFWGALKIMLRTKTWDCGDVIIYAGQNYNTVQIGTQCWFKENLNIGTMIDGLNEQGTDCFLPTEIEKYCYSNDEANCTSDGALYQWDQAMCGSTTAGAQGICPDGWHIPTHDEFTDLARQVCRDNGHSNCDMIFPKNTSTYGWLGTDEGDSLKTASTCHGGENCGTSGFDAFLTGYRFTLEDGSFVYNGSSTLFWSSSLWNSSYAWRRSLHSDYTGVCRSYNDKLDGFSVRCLKD